MGKRQTQKYGMPNGKSKEQRAKYYKKDYYTFKTKQAIGCPVPLNHDKMQRQTKTQGENINKLMLKDRIVTALTLTLPGPSAGVSGSLDSYCSLKPLCSGMGEVVPARTSPTLLPPSPRTVLSLSCFKVLQCINCCDWHCKS